jgi:hypothetical protein
VARAVLVLIFLFVALWLVRVLLVLVRQWLRQAGGVRRPPAVEGEMARDPVCGAWFDRRFAVTGRHEGQLVEVCSEGCRRRLEAG